MDYQEAIEALQFEGGIEITGNPRRAAEFFDGIDVAISAMQELHEYHKLGTLEEIKLLKETHLTGVELAQISCMLKQLAEYEKIGTLKEVREAVEKQNPKTPTYEGDGYAPDGSFVWDEWICPRCGTSYEVDYDEYDYCPNCGQSIDWSEEE